MEFLMNYSSLNENKFILSLFHTISKLDPLDCFRFWMNYDETWGLPSQILTFYTYL